jgi:aconitate hydratase
MKIHSIPELVVKYPQVESLPYSLKVLLENLLRNQDDKNVTQEQVDALINWDPNSTDQPEIQFTPARVVMQDFTGVPCVVDLASMREAIADLGGDPQKINPLKTAQLVIDHSVQIDSAGTSDSLANNMSLEFIRNRERYEFLKWGGCAFNNFEVIPPGVGIIHQINLERLAEVVRQDSGEHFYDSCVGTDSHTTMINGIGVLGWGVGGIEAEAAMLGQSVSMLIPQVVGFKLTGKPADNVFATDIILTITQKLRELGVVGKIVEFFGSAVGELDIPVRATISNMCPEFGATAAMFGVDQKTVDYLKFSGRSAEICQRVEDYHKAQGTFGDIPENTRYSQVLELDLSSVVPSIAGPKRPQDRINLADSKGQFVKDLANTPHNDQQDNAATDGEDPESLTNGDIVIASITSCTNTSNPEVLIAAGLVAKKAVERGLSIPEHVKTSFAPGSPVVLEYLEKAGLQKYLDQLGFNVVGFGCATCIGNSGPNPQWVSEQVKENNLAVAAVLSGNRNFEGRINPDVKMNYLASPPLVVAYAIAGSMTADLALDLLPTHAEINEVMAKVLGPDLFLPAYDKVISGSDQWQKIQTSQSNTFNWDKDSTYILKAPYFDGMSINPEPIKDIKGARILLNLGDSVTTDHISPAGAIKADSPAGRYLTEHGVEIKDFNSYGSRRGNHEVMVRGTFANIRLVNKLVNDFTGSEVAGGWTVDFTNDKNLTPVFDASINYKRNNTPLIVFAGKEYGTGSSRDWAAKGTALLGVKAVIAQSFERIHRSNLIGMGILPLQFADGQNFAERGLKGDEVFEIEGIDSINQGHISNHVSVIAKNPDSGEIVTSFDAKVRIDTETEEDYYRNGGILQYVLRNLAKDSK